jgi:tetratricopeptide (TPR) repeat protein
VTARKDIDREASALASAQAAREKHAAIIRGVLLRWEGERGKTTQRLVFQSWLDLVEDDQQAKVLLGVNTVAPPAAVVPLETSSSWTMPTVEGVNAAAWKERGNAAFKAGDHETAIAAYSKGIEAGNGAQNPENCALYSNRALCAQKLGRFEEATADAEICVALKPDFPKGYQRGAMALKGLGKPVEAYAFMDKAPPAMVMGNAEIGALHSELKAAAQKEEERRLRTLEAELSEVIPRLMEHDRALLFESFETTVRPLNTTQKVFWAKVEVELGIPPGALDIRKTHARVIAAASRDRLRSGSTGRVGGWENVPRAELRSGSPRE